MYSRLLGKRGTGTAFSVGHKGPLKFFRQITRPPDAMIESPRATDVAMKPHKLDWAKYYYGQKETGTTKSEEPLPERQIVS